jgi:hypothetical protein
VFAENAVNSPVGVTVTASIEQPLLTLGADAVLFVRVGSGDVTPEVETIELYNDGPGDLAALGEISCLPSDEDLIRCDVLDEELELSLDPAFLEPGLNVYTVWVEAENSAISRTITVTVHVMPNPELSLSPPALHFSAVRGSTTVQSGVVEVRNPLGGSVSSISCPAAPAAWVTCSVSGNGVNVGIQPSGLTASPPVATVLVTARLWPQDRIVTTPLTVSLNVEQPVLALSGYILELRGTASGTVTAQNPGAGLLASLGTVSCSAGANLSCAVDQATKVVTVTGVPDALDTGVYVRQVTISAANATNSQTVTVVLTVPIPLFRTTGTAP